MEKQLFPADLLDRTNTEKINYFKQYSVGHPFLSRAFSECLENIAVSERNEILLIYGPTGVGKSKLFTRILKYYEDLYYKEMSNNKGFIPILGEEASSPDDGKFDWKDFYIRVLEKLNEPLIDFKKNLHLNSKGIIPKENNKTAYRRSVENALKYRQPIVFLIDEAQHLSRIPKGKKLKDQMETLKSIASKSEVPIVLIGTYDVLKFRNLGGQLVRRGMDVHLPRYRANIQEEKDYFINALWMFQKHLPFPIELSLIDDWEYFYLHSAGCIGVLKQWLNRTVNHCLLKDPNRSELNLKDFKKFELSVDKIEKIVDEAIEGEKLLQQSNIKENSVRLKLGLDMLEPTNLDGKAKGNKNPGQRKPKRDEVGLGEFENTN